MSWRSTALRLARTTIRSLGNDVLIAGESGRGILRSPEESVLDGMVYVTDYLLEVPVTQWPTVLEGTSITVDGVAYTAREQGRINRDGSSVFVPLTPVTVPPAEGLTITTLGGVDLTTLGGDPLVTIASAPVGSGNLTTISGVELTTLDSRELVTL